MDPSKELQSIKETKMRTLKSVKVGQNVVYIDHFSLPAWGPPGKTDEQKKSSPLPIDTELLNWLTGKAIALLASTI